MSTASPLVRLRAGGNVIIQGLGPTTLTVGGDNTSTTASGVSLGAPAD
jgi:hypothetical protein